MEFPKVEDSVVERAIANDAVAFACLYESYKEWMYRHILYRVANKTDAEDITQDVFVRAWKAIGKYQMTGAPFLAWLIVISRNLIASHFKSKKNLTPIEESIMVQLDGETPEALAEASINRGYVSAAIMKLKGEKQRVIWMRFIEGKTYTQIADSLQKSEGAVRVIQHRAIADLRKLLGKCEGGLCWEDAAKTWSSIPARR